MKLTAKSLLLLGVLALAAWLYAAKGSPGGVPGGAPAGGAAVTPVFQAKLPPAEQEFRNAPAVVDPDAAAPVLPPLDGLLRDAQPAAQAAAFAPGRSRAPALRPGEKLDAKWRVNAVPFDDRPGLKLIAVVIDDAGLDRARTARAIRLPGPLTISFLPYGGDLPRQTDEARRHGHELMLHLPMEPISPAEDPGPNPLTTWLAPEEMQRRLSLSLSRFDGFVGVNNHMGSRMTLDIGALLPVLDQVRARGLLFVDSRTISGSVAGALADRMGIPGAARDVFIDHDGSEEAVAARLADIERIALRQGQALAIGHPHDLTLAALERWLPTLAQRGFTLAPVSALAERRLARHPRLVPASAGPGG